MEYYNTITIVFANKEVAAKKADAVKIAMNAMCAQEYGYSEAVNFGEIFGANIKYDGDKSFLISEDDRCGFATPEDCLDLIIEYAKKLANSDTATPFCIANRNTGTYTDSSVEITYADKQLRVKTVYYPEGDYDNMLTCPECDEEIVAMSKYEQGKIYTCPECGEECDLSDAYEEVCPVLEERTIEI